MPILMGAIALVFVVFASGVTVDTGAGNRGHNSPQIQAGSILNAVTQYGNGNQVNFNGPSSYDPANIGSSGWSDPFGSDPNKRNGTLGQTLNNVGNAADGGYQITKIVNNEIYGQEWTSKGLVGKEQKLFSGAGAKVGDVVYVDQGKAAIVNPAK